MPQYILAVWHTDDYPSLPEDELMAAFERVDDFNAKLEETGAWVFACGLPHPSTARMVYARGDDVTVKDGPASASHEFLGGFWVVEAEDDEAAEALAIEGAQACGNAVEIRRLQGT